MDYNSSRQVYGIPRPCAVLVVYPEHSLESPGLIHLSSEPWRGRCDRPGAVSTNCLHRGYVRRPWRGCHVITYAATLSSIIMFGLQRYSGLLGSKVQGLDLGVGGLGCQSVAFGRLILGVEFPVEGGCRSMRGLMPSATFQTWMVNLLAAEICTIFLQALEVVLLLAGTQVFVLIPLPPVSGPCHLFATLGRHVTGPSKRVKQTASKQPASDESNPI